MATLQDMLKYMEDTGYTIVGLIGVANSGPDKGSGFIVRFSEAVPVEDQAGLLHGLAAGAHPTPDVIN
jgi:hypothetical protein